MRASILLTASAALSMITAQQTLIVDQNGGGHFTDLTPALVAAQPGDIVLMRGGGNYPATYGVMQPITLTADQPRPQVAALTIGVGATSPAVVLSHIDFGTMLIATAGRVVAEDLTVRQLDTISALGLAMNGCTIGGPQPRAGMSVYAIPLVLTNCVVRGADGYCDAATGTLFHGGRALGLSRFGVAELADCVLIGGAGGNLPCGLAAPGSAVILDFVSPRIGTSLLQGGAGVGTTGNSIHVVRNVFPPVLDPTVQLVGPVVGPITTALVPKAAGSGAMPGGVMQCRVDAPPQLPAVLFASFGFVGATSRPEGLAWVNVPAMVVLAAGSTGALGTLTGQIVLPSTVRRGWVITVQGAVFSVPTITLTTPAMLTVL